MADRVKKVAGLGMLLVCLMAAQILGPLGAARIPAYASESQDEPLNLYAQCAVLMDGDSGRILFGKNEGEVRPMASTTKIMTCILALEQMEEGQTATVSDYAASQPKVRLGVKGKEEYLIGDLLYALMLESYNDSAVVIAESISGSVEAFAKLMNEKAMELGCEDTHFVTPNGLDGEDEGGIHATTAADLARIMRYCIRESPKKDDFLKITRTKTYQFTDCSGKRSFTCTNHNAFLDMMEGALSGKTGFTADAGYCYVGALTQGERTFIVALLACGWPNNKGYKWKDTRALMEYGLANYEYREITVDVSPREIPVVDGVKPESPFAAETTVLAGLPHPESFQILLGKEEQVEIQEEYQEFLSAPAAKGEKAGKVLCMLDGDEIREYQVVTLEAAQKRDLGWCLSQVVKRWAL